MADMKEIGDKMKDAASKATDAMKNSGTKMAEGSSAVGLKVLDQAEQNTREAFAAMRAAASAKDLSEVMKIQGDFLREQGTRSMGQAREIGELIMQFGPRCRRAVARERLASTQPRLPTGALAADQITSIDSFRRLAKRRIMNTVFKALADPTRRSVLESLREGPKTAGQLSGLFPVSRPTMSAHFAVLRDAGLIAVHRDGKNLVYRLQLSVLEDALLSFGQLFGIGWSSGEDRSKLGPST